MRSFLLLSSCLSIGFAGLAPAAPVPLDLSGEVLFANGFENPAVSAACVDLPPPNYLGTPLLGQQTQTWGSAFLAEFPRTNVTYPLSMRNRYYEAIEFTASAAGSGIPASGLLEGVQASFSAGAAVIAISDCEGDFSATRLNVGNRVCLSPAGGKLSLPWTTDPAANPNACVLVPGQRYYLNLTFGRRTSPGFSEPWCPDEESCSHRIYSRGF